MATIRKNERSWGIEIISQINQFTNANDLLIKRAGGESTISETKGKSMFPDVILYGDNELSSILQGWELKMPDVPITDSDFINDAHRKAKALSLNSCVIWNFRDAKLYVYDDEADEFLIKREWYNQEIRSRNDVEYYKTNWENTLKDVLTSVNEFLVSGDLKRTFIGDVLTNKSVSAIINSHKFYVADELRNNVCNDAIMEAYIDTWWNSISSEYEGDETDKYVAYAKSIIINWTNRIIFAHLIKRSQIVAFSIDYLDYTSSPEDANRIFRDITEKSDFYNIFSAVNYDELLPVQTWQTLVELSLILKDSPIKSLNLRILQQILESSVNISKRLVNGQYPTPPILAKILSRITMQNPLGECFDGCCGTGTIPNCIINLKKSKVGVSKAMATTWASDKFKLPLQIANLSMTSYDTIDKPCRLFQKDILTIKPGDKIQILNPKTGENETYELPLFDAIISNLPFVNSSNLPEEDIECLNRIKLEHNLNNRSDYSYCIALHLKNLVKEKGHVGLILSNSFLGTEAGLLFINAIRSCFDEIKIHISGNGKWFDNANVVTVLLVMRKNTDKNKNKNITFYTWKRNLLSIESNEYYENIIVNSTLLSEDIDNSVISRVNYNEDDLSNLIKLNISYNSMFTDINWLLKISTNLVPISDYFTIFRGSRRGWDNMFYPNENNGIESLFLKTVLRNARTTDSYIAIADQNAFCCSLSIEELKSGGYNGALNWINKFSKERNQVGRPLPEVLARNGMHWYELKPNEIAEIFTMMNPEDRMFYGKFKRPSFVNQRLIGLKRNNESYDLDLLHALLNTTLSLFFIEATGFGRGLGVLDINKNSISKCYVLNPELLKETQIQDIKASFTKMIGRGIVNIEQDLEDPIRKEFDLVVLKAYGIDSYYDCIVNSLRSMRNIRKTVRCTPNILIQQTEYNSNIQFLNMNMAADNQIVN